MSKKILIFVLAVMGMFTVINAATMELAVTNGSFKNYFTVGISPSIKLFSNFYLEGEFFYLPRTEAISTSHLEYISGDGLHISETRYRKNSAINLNISILYQLKFKSTQKWVPFLTTGTGLLSTSEKWQSFQRMGDNYYSNAGSNRENKWSFAFGGGIKYGFNNKVGVRFDARLLYMLNHEDGETLFAFFGPRFTGGFYIKL
jgi:hypothetical protein